MSLLLTLLGASALMTSVGANSTLAMKPTRVQHQVNPNIKTLIRGLKFTRWYDEIDLELNTTATIRTSEIYAEEDHLTQQDEFFVSWEDLGIKNNFLNKELNWNKSKISFDLILNQSDNFHNAYAPMNETIDFRGHKEIFDHKPTVFETEHISEIDEPISSRKWEFDYKVSDEGIHFYTKVNIVINDEKLSFLTASITIKNINYSIESVRIPF